MLSDTFNRPLRNLRLSVTDRCNLRCSYCMPESDYVWLPREDLLHFEEIDKLVDIFLDLGLQKVRITGGEPLLRRDLSSLIARLAAKQRLQDLALTTNGVLLAPVAHQLKKAGLHRLTVSLDTLQRNRFEKIARFDELDRVLDGIKTSAPLFPGLKIDMVVIRGVNDDELSPMIEFGKQFGAEVRFIEYMDVGGATRWSPDAVVSRTELLQRLATHYGTIEMIDEQSSAPAQRYQFNDGTSFGIIASTTEPFCSQCDRSRLTADGMWYLCLYASGGVSLRSPLRSNASVEHIQTLVQHTWEKRNDRGAETRLSDSDRAAFVPVDTLRKDPHLEMHTRGG